MWQISGAHGRIDPDKAIPAMKRYTDAGFTTWDLADHYGPAEEFVREFRQILNASGKNPGADKSRFFTKWVPRPTKMPRKIVEAAVDLSRRRMGMETLDLLQFHWWDYSNPQFIEALKHLDDLRQEGKIFHLALTNFDTQHWGQILAADIEAVSNQVQYSLIDSRPSRLMAEFCETNDLKMLAYGTVCGGFLAEKYLNVPEPTVGQLNTSSLRKYKNMIDAWGGWSLFQDLLRTLKKIADKHQVSIPNVATSFVLEQPYVAGIIIGVRLGISDHITDNIQVFDFHLDDEDFQSIEVVTQKSRDLFRLIGDCGDEYR